MAIANPAVGLVLVVVREAVGSHEHRRAELEASVVGDLTDHAVNARQLAGRLGLLDRHEDHRPEARLLASDVDRLLRVDVDLDHEVDVLANREVLAREQVELAVRRRVDVCGGPSSSMSLMAEISMRILLKVPTGTSSA